MKYPGAFFAYEYGTAKELAKSYGVSERTIYRWKAKAQAESGARAKKPRRPRLSTLEKFKGTRKELAKKYGVSERTAYRWLKQAKEKGANIPSRQKKANYPGEFILNEYGTNKDLAKTYGVSERTIQRWKARARSEITMEESQIQPESPPIGQTEAPKDDFFSEVFDGVPEEETPSEFETPDISETSEKYKARLDDISSMLTEYDLLVQDSIFGTLDDEQKRTYLNAYIQYQWDMNPYQFNQSPPDDPNGPDISDPEKIANIDIWGDEFETWLVNQIEIDNT